MYTSHFSVLEVTYLLATVLWEICLLFVKNTIMPYPKKKYSNFKFEIKASSAYQFISFKH